MLTLKCQECNNEFEAQRTSAKFCSAKCRVKFNSYEHPIKDLNDYTKIDTEEAKKSNSMLSFVDDDSLLILTKGKQPSVKVTVVNKDLGVSRVLTGEPNENFSLLLKEFNHLVENAPKYEDVKVKLDFIKSTAINSNLTPRQQDAILDRITFFKNGEYDLKPKDLKLA